VEEHERAAVAVELLGPLRHDTAHYQPILFAFCEGLGSRNLDCWIVRCPLAVLTDEFEASSNVGKMNPSCAVFFATGTAAIFTDSSSLFVAIEAFHYCLTPWNSAVYTDYLSQEDDFQT
jgi:hypothetical protein